MISECELKTLEATEPLEIDILSAPVQATVIMKVVPGYPTYPHSTGRSFLLMHSSAQCSQSGSPRSSLNWTGPVCRSP